MVFTALDTTLYRIVFEDFAHRALKGVIHPEGRFHRDGQKALYASPSPQTAAIAIRRYLQPGDAPRVMIRLKTQSTRLVDLRDPKICQALQIEPSWPSVPWSGERAAGKFATSWRASDAVRLAGADGMIYASRTAPERWHVVLFRWNDGNSAQVTLAGQSAPWVPQ